jgi:hypothetical protein
MGTGCLGRSSQLSDMRRTLIPGSKMRWFISERRFQSLSNRICASQKEIQPSDKCPSHITELLKEGAGNTGFATYGDNIPVANFQQSLSRLLDLESWVWAGRLTRSEIGLFSVAVLSFGCIIISRCVLIIGNQDSDLPTVVFTSN